MTTADSILDLIHIPPAVGYPTGNDGWMFCVEMAQLTAPSRWDDPGTKWDVALWAALQWEDITGRVRGVSWNSGTPDPQPGIQRFPVGGGTVELDNTDSRFSSWNTANADYHEYSTGALVRISTYTGTPSWSATVSNGMFQNTYTNWVPLFTGYVTAVGDVMEQVATERRVELTLEDPTAVLARLSRTAGAPVGAHDTSDLRFVRLVNDAGYPFGAASVDGVTGFTLLATTMAGNRLTELQLTAESTGQNFIGGPDGAATLLGAFRKRWLFGTNAAPYWATTHPFAAVDADALAFSNNIDLVINDITVANVGGTVYTSTLNANSIASRNKFGTISYSRTDLISENDISASNLLGALEVFHGVNPGGYLDGTLGVKSVQVTNRDGNAEAVQRGAFIYDETMFQFVDRGQPSRSQPTAVFYSRIAGMTHNVTPRKGSVTWTSTYQFLQPGALTGAEAAPTATFF